MYKFCNKCKKNKLISEFNKKKSSNDGYQSICKDCNRKYLKQHYINNKGYYKNKSKSKRIDNALFFVDIKKGLQCRVCGEKEPCCLEFHHINPKEKEEDVSTLVSNGCSKKTILKEIKKCIPLCSNCHKKLHAGIIKI